MKTKGILIREKNIFPLVRFIMYSTVFKCSQRFSSLNIPQT